VSLVHQHRFDSAATILERLYGAARSFASGVTPLDDMTAIIVRAMLPRPRLDLEYQAPGNDPAATESRHRGAHHENPSTIDQPAYSLCR
jgi:hypothetical protein